PPLAVQPRASNSPAAPPGWTPATSSATLEPVTVPAGARAAHPPPSTPARDHPRQGRLSHVSREPHAVKPHRLLRRTLHGFLQRGPVARMWHATRPWDIRTTACDPRLDLVSAPSCARNPAAVGSHCLVSEDGP